VGRGIRAAGRRGAVVVGLAGGVVADGVVWGAGGGVRPMRGRGALVVGAGGGALGSVVWGKAGRGIRTTGGGGIAGKGVGGTTVGKVDGMTMGAGSARALSDRVLPTRAETAHSVIARAKRIFMLMCTWHSGANFPDVSSGGPFKTT